MSIADSDIMTEGEIWTVKGLLQGQDFKVSYSSWDCSDPEATAREVYDGQAFLINTTLTRQRLVRSWDEVIESKDGPETREQGEADCPAHWTTRGRTMHEVPIDLAKATTMAPSVDDGSAGWTTPGRVPEAAVEAAAKAIYGVSRSVLDPEDGFSDEWATWEQASENKKAQDRKAARAALEAAAPHMLLEVITTVEELDALPFETVIRDGDEHILERWGDLEDGGWVTVMVSSFIPRDQITLPATVIYRPTP